MNQLMTTHCGPEREAPEKAPTTPRPTPAPTTPAPEPDTPGKERERCPPTGPCPYTHPPDTDALAFSYSPIPELAKLKAP